MPSVLQVPVIDISGLQQILSQQDSNKDPNIQNEVISQIGKACEEWGFFYVVNHDVPLKLISDTSNLSRAFFKMPKEFKESVIRTETNFQGYSDSELTKQKVDWKEIYDFTPEVDVQHQNLDIHGVNQWPDMPEFKPAISTYMQEMQKLTRKLLKGIVKSLTSDLSIVNECFEGSGETSVCRLNFYPKCPDPSKHLGVGPHSDPGILTVLLQDDNVSSLQVLKDGTWYDIAPVKDSFVINIGDMMEVWSNGRYKAPVHRVLANHDHERFSLPYFLAPSYSCMMKPLPGTYDTNNKDKPKKFREFSWAEFRRGRYEGDYADKGEEIQIMRYRL